MPVRSMKRAIIPLISLFIFVISNGFFMTFVSVFLDKKHYSTAIIGGMTAAFYAGLGVASLMMEGQIAKVGHIRAFSALVSGLAVVTLVQGLWVNPWFWLLMRFLAGYFTAGLYVVVESWLLLLGNRRSRTKLLAMYMITLYAAQSLGQLLINVEYVNSLIPYVIAAMLCSLSLIPMALMKLQVPRFEEATRLNFIQLFRLSASGMISCFCSGLILASIYGLMPIFLLKQVGDLQAVSWLMMVVILGGMSLQYPIGRLSDYIERRFVLIIICSAFLIVASALFYAHNVWSLGVLIFLFGGLTFTIYPVAISLVCDHVEDKQIVAATQGLSLAYGIGCVIGPMLASLGIRVSDPNGYLAYFILVSVALILFLLIRRARVESVPQDEHFIPVPQTTPVAAELDPRGEN